MDARSCASVVERHPDLTHLYPKPGEVLLLLETDGQGGQPLEEIERAGELCLSHQARDIWLPSSSNQASQMWRFRRSISASLRESHRHVTADDVCVPLSALMVLAELGERLAVEHGIVLACYGHLGDGNLHVTMLCQTETEATRAVSARDALYAMVWRLGGTISAEHGIGLGRRNALAHETGSLDLAAQRAVKHLFDPRGLMNPGKLFPD
jgi:FAD/FMN-containing dehydrogenase